MTATLTETPADVADVADDADDGANPSAAHRWQGLLVAAGAYLALSLTLWWNVWSTHPTSTTTCGCGDSSLFTWFLAWPAYAISHGLNPLYSSALFHPTGVNLPANTSELAFGVSLAPVTWIFGPIATLNVALTLTPVLSALAMFVLLRRWVAWPPAAFIGGLLYGFSPLVLVSLSDAHLMVGALVVPPLLVGCLDELLIRQRRRPIPTGVVLGLLVGFQFFIGTEVLTITVIVGFIGVVLLLLYGLRHPEELRRRLRPAVVGVASAVATAGVVLAYPLWFTLDGPAHFSGTLWTSQYIGLGGVRLRDYVLPVAADPRFTNLTHQFGGYQGGTLSGQYLGVGLLVVVAGGLVVWRRDRRLWLFSAVAAISVWLSLDRKTFYWVPWRVLAKVPLIQNIIPSRFLTVTYLAAAVMLGVIVDRTRETVNRQLATADGPPTDGPVSTVGPGGRWSNHFRWRIGGVMAALLVAAVALVPVAAYLAQTIPFVTQPVLVPTWFRTVAPHLSGRQVLLVYPAPFALTQSAMTWQAVDGMHYSMVGGTGPGSVLSRAGKERQGQVVITFNSLTSRRLPESPSDFRAAREALQGWGVTMVVIPDQPDLPYYQRVRSVPSSVALMTAAIGEPPIHQADAWVWTGVATATATPTAVPTSSAYLACLVGPKGTPTATASIPGCILAAPPAR